MKNVLLPICSLFFLNSFSYAGELDPDLLKPMIYSVEIQDSNHKPLFTANLNNISKKAQEQSIDNSYIDNCIKNKGIVESTKSSVKTGYNISFAEESNTATDLVIQVSKVVNKNKINTGECSIEDLSVGKVTLRQNLPFMVYEYKFHLVDSSGKELPDLYYIKASGKVLKK